jgi:peptidoglycan hydrolase-like protein with peptidoglycan-binding domain
MGLRRPRSHACALLALVIVGVLACAPATQAKTKGKPHRTFAFGARLLGPGAKGKDVRYLQHALGKLGIATAVDGAFGKSTRKSVMAFESQQGWPVDGRISRKEAKRIKRLLAARRATGSYFVFGRTLPTLTLSAKGAGEATVKAKDASGNTVQVIPVSFTGRGFQDVAWDGATPSGFAPDGTYRLKLADRGSARASVSGGQLSPFTLHLHMFPVPGTHDFGGADSRFGAPRSGHTHQGQDVAAACGERLYAIETGTVSVNAFQATGAGYYIVIHGRATSTDAVYMHLQAPSSLPAGSAVSVHQVIGRVGDTGDAMGCHLHFERWSAPGWYVGGSAYDPLPELLYWDSYS